MRHLFVVLLLFLTGESQARILIQAASASSQDLQSYLRLHPEIKSYQDYIWEGLQTNPSQEQLLFNLVDLSPEDRARGLELVARLNNERPLTPLSLRFLADLTEQWLKQNPGQNLHSELQSLSCKARSLQQKKDIRLNGCRLETFSTELLKTRYPQMEVLAVESQPIPLSSGQKINLLAEGRYHFTLISNSQQPLHFYGTFRQLQEQNLQPSTLAAGTCDLPSFQLQDLDLMNEGIVFFSQDCLRLVKDTPPPSNKGWWQRNKSWVYPAAAIVFAGSLYALRDKTLIFDTSLLK